MTRTPYYVNLCDEAFYRADSPQEATAILVAIETRKPGPDGETDTAAFLPTVLHVKVNGFEVVLNGGVGELLLHGRKLEGVQSFSISADGLSMPRLSLDFALPAVKKGAQP